MHAIDSLAAHAAAEAYAPGQADSRQLTLLSARDAGEEAGAACLAKAERVAQFDTEGARSFILACLAERGKTSGEALTDAAKAVGYVPHDDRAYGPVYASLRRRNLIRCVGFCERLKGHSTAGGRVWELVG